MTEKKLLQGLKTLISIHGVAHISDRLKYRDTQTIQKWIRGGRIPEVRRDAVRALIEAAKK